MRSRAERLRPPGVSPSLLRVMFSTDDDVGRVDVEDEVSAFRATGLFPRCESERHKQRHPISRILPHRAQQYCLEALHAAASARVNGGREGCAQVLLGPRHAIGVVYVLFHGGAEIVEIHNRLTAEFRFPCNLRELTCHPRHCDQVAVERARRPLFATLSPRCFANHIGKRTAHGAFLRCPPSKRLRQVVEGLREQFGVGRPIVA